MKRTLRHLLIFSAIWIATLWILFPGGASWYFGHDAMVRFDPRISTDYNCIFIEGYAAKRFELTWLKPSLPSQYLRIRYVPMNDPTPYGIMFIDPRTMAYEAHSGWASAPAHLDGRLNSWATILSWMQSQPGAEPLASHTNDAKEIFNAIQYLTPRDLQHFIYPTNPPLKNFAVTHQWTAKSDTPQACGNSDSRSHLGRPN